jgi:hypothetical protein
LFRAVPVPCSHCPRIAQPLSNAGNRCLNCAPPACLASRHQLGCGSLRLAGLHSHAHAPLPFRSRAHKKIGGKRIAPCRHRSRLQPHCSLPETSVVLKLLYCGSFQPPAPSPTRFCGPSGAAPAPGGGGGDLAARNLPTRSRSASLSTRPVRVPPRPLCVARAVCLHLLPLLRRQLAANRQQEARIRLFQLRARLRHLVDLGQNLASFGWSSSSAAPAPAPPSAGWRAGRSASRDAAAELRPSPCAARRSASACLHHLRIVPPAWMVALRPNARSIGGRCSPKSRSAIPIPAAGPCASADPAINHSQPATQPHRPMLKPSSKFLPLPSTLSFPSIACDVLFPHFSGLRLVSAIS